ncbi:hypothetical protein DYB32_007441 [Aphanomyces invadans]|uniref:AMP-dependent synthetase/ligase domain-containing protein n=1 Tax=Aphanomyces invadans TaxID=157072 RepID=A0A418ANX9_9STRA|nr:hypothetical protein DYB32_007441 [Aphanomyces invadans]
MLSSAPYTKVIEDEHKMPGAKFFPGARLNFAENLLRHRDDRTALVFKSETSNKATRITYNQLYDQVAAMSQRLRQLGIAVGDRVVGYMPNTPDTIVAMLAATSIGAVWSSCSPDFGKNGVLDRFAQITPKVVFATDGYFYKGKRIDTLPGLKDILHDLPTVQKVVIFRYTIAPSYDLDLSALPNAQYVDHFLAELNGPVQTPIQFEQLPFDHPVYIMYSSGTTGLPKCIVQGPGVLLNHLKEHILHLNVSRDDVVFYYTTTGWMMWNWLVSGLAVGATVVLFDGNPLYPGVSALWQFAEEIGMTVFGTSARYLAAVMDSGCKPGKEFNLSKLKMLASTGSPASTNIFNFVYTEIKSDIQFASISGGTDLNGCFALGCTNLPVYNGELQLRGLGLDVAIYSDNGEKLEQAQGELVCLKPFPSMPLYFYGDSDGSKYFSACTDHIFRHGRGVRIGTADIYKVVEHIKEVADSVIVGQDYTLSDGTPDVKIVLFVVLPAGVHLTAELQKSICAKIRKETSPRHVPGLIVACPDIPYTVSGKKVEIAVKRILAGKTITNASALRNPESLAWFESYAATIAGQN